MFSKLNAIVLSIVALFAASASAVTITGTLTKVSPGDSVNITVSGVNSGNAFNTSAGVFDWQGTLGNPNGLQGIFYTFCIDLYQTVQNPTVWTESTSLGSYPTGGTATAMGSTAATEIERMWTADYATANPQPAGGPLLTNPTATQNDNAAGFQLAIWEIVTMGELNKTLNSSGPNGYFNSGNGNTLFQLNSAPSGAITDANNFLADALNSHNQATALDAIYSSSAQDQTILLPSGAPPATPLPSAFWGGSALLGGLIFINHRRKKGQMA